MKESVYKMIGASSHSESEREKQDYYATDPRAVVELLRREEIASSIWECAAGEGHIVSALLKNGKRVYSSDILQRDFQIDSVQDFLSAESMPILFEDADILTNPPYCIAEKFVLKSMQLLKPGRKAIFLLRLQFLEGVKRYFELFSEYPPKKVYVFCKRIICAKGGMFEKYTSSAICYAWFVFEKGYKGKPEIEWIPPFTEELYQYNLLELLYENM